MKVKCINQGNFKNITTGNEYEVYFDNGEMWSVVTDDLSVRNYSKRYFEIIQEPIIEDINEVGVEEENSGFTVEFDENSNNIEIHIGEFMSILYYYQVASNCGVHSYNGVNDLFEYCNGDKDLFKEIINGVIELITDKENCCMFILSTNDEYGGVWEVLDEIMDTKSESIENPNSYMNVKLWIKYIN